MKKILAILLTVCMVVCMIPGAAFAADPIAITDANVFVNGDNNCIYDTDITDSNGTKAIRDNVIVVKIDNETLNKDSDYKLITDIGDKVVNIRITGEGSYTGEVVKAFDIKTKIDNEKYFISDKTDNPTKDDFITACTYTGKEIIPSGLKLYKSDGKTVIANGYTVSVDSANVGTRTITFTGTGNLIGTVTKTFAVEPADITNTTIVAPIAKTTDAIDAYKAKVDVKLGDNILPKTDYDIAIKKDGNDVSDFKTEGKYTVIVTSKKGNLNEGSKSAGITVEQGYEGGSITVKDNETTYDGKEHKATLKINNNNLPNNYIVKYQKDNTLYNAAVGAGVYTIIVTDDKGGSTEAGKYTVNMLKASDKSSDKGYMTIYGLKSEYSTALNKPVVPDDFSVYWGNTLLKKGVDYTVSAINNTGKNIATTATMTISFKGNFTGELKRTFKVTVGNELSNYTVYIPNIADQAYTGTYVKPYVSVYYGGPTAVTARTLLTENVHYTLSYSSNINAGTATVTVTGKGAYSGSVSKTFAIKYNLSNATVTTTPATYAYDGRIKQPAVTVKIGYVTVPASDYIVTYSNNLKVGTATATVTAKTYGKSMGSNMAYFTITGKDGVITPEYAEYSKKTTKSKPFAIKIVSNTTDGTGYSYVSSDTSVATVSANGTVTPVGCGRTVITITTTGNKAYNPATATVTVTVKPTKGIISSLKSTAKGKLTVRYKKQSPNADYYQIRYGRAGDYTTKTIKNTSARTGKSTIKGLQSDKKYFIKVRGVKDLADGTVLYGSWSKVKNAVTK